MEDIADGGAALTAYGKLQYTDMSPEEHLELKNSPLKYCELETLAMVMIVELLGGNSQRHLSMTANRLKARIFHLKRI